MRKQLSILLSLSFLWVNASFAQDDSEPVASLLETEKTESINETTGLNNNTVAFKLVGGLIIVDAQTEGTTKSFILDTGAPTLVLNQKIPRFHPAKNFAVGVAGMASAIDVDIDYFRLGNISNPDLDAFATDISHLERLKSTTIDGLIGYEVLKHTNLLLDYERQEITMLPSGEEHQVAGKRRVLAIPFKSRGHIPVIEVQVGKKKLRMGIDSGSEANLLDIRLKRRYRKWYPQRFTTRYVRGIDQSVLKASSAKIADTHINGHALEEMEYLFTEMDFLNRGWGKRMDGILGYPFLQANLVSIDFKEKILYVYEDKLLEELEKVINHEDKELAEAN